MRPGTAARVLPGCFAEELPARCRPVSRLALRLVYSLAGGGSAPAPKPLNRGREMPKKQELQALVDAHKSLDDRMTGAIWIRRDEPGAWLVEILPDLPDDPTVGEPVVFSPSWDFRYSLHLIAGNLQSLKEAIRGDVALARDLVEGDPLHTTAEADELISEARTAVGL